MPNVEAAVEIPEFPAVGKIAEGITAPRRPTLGIAGQGDVIFENEGALPSLPHDVREDGGVTEHATDLTGAASRVETGEVSCESSFALGGLDPDETERLAVDR